MDAMRIGALGAAIAAALAASAAADAGGAPNAFLGDWVLIDRSEPCSPYFRFVEVGAKVEWLIREPHHDDYQPEDLTIARSAERLTFRHDRTVEIRADQLHLVKNGQTLCLFTRGLGA